MKHLLLACTFLFGLMLTILAPAPVNAAAGAPSAEALNKAAAKQMLREVLKENPDILMEALDNLRKQMETGQASASRDNLVRLRQELERDPDTFVAGNPLGDITIVEFFDYRCGYCKQAQPDIQKLVKQDGRIRLALKEFPILGPDSLIASRAAIAAMRQDKYAPFHDALMASQGPLSETRVLRIASDIGIDAARLRRDMDDPKIEKIIGRNHEIAESLGISGTPSFIIGDTLVPGVADLEKLRELVAAARDKCLTC